MGDEAGVGGARPQGAREAWSQIKSPGGGLISLCLRWVSKVRSVSLYGANKSEKFLSWLGSRGQPMDFGALKAERIKGKGKGEESE